MSTPLISPVILSGGAGTRLWPLSRSLFPKQLLHLGGPRSLLQETALRATGDGFAAPLIIANEDHRFLIAEQMRVIGVKPAAIILEPQGRNTAPAIALAACRAAREDADGLLLVMPSDHLIRDEAAFRAAIEKAVPAARAGHLVTFGITPDRPETGYGYIAAGDALDGLDGVSRVAAFVEKPDLATAQTYVAGGRHLWNAGIFLFSASRFLAELEAFEPAIHAATTAAMAKAGTDLDFERPDATAFADAPSISIDYAVMERTGHAAVVPVAMGWSDIGSFDALWEVTPQDASGNATTGDVILHDTRDSLIWSEGPAVAALGVEGLVIVATPDAVLVAPRDRAQDVKHIVERMKRDKRSLPDSHVVVHRPWGSYQATDQGERFQTKRLVVKPGEKLSLQKHHHRAEHWVVVQGTARVTCDDKILMLSENESTFIPLGAVHRLENPGKIPLHIIEVQSGSYLGEDDIVRFEDTYGRAPL